MLNQTLSEAVRESTVDDDRLFKLITGAIDASEKSLMVCSSIPLGRELVCRLLATPGLVSVILRARDETLENLYPGRVGCFLGLFFEVQLPISVGRELLFLGSPLNFGTRLAWRAWRSGVRRVRFAAFPFLLRSRNMAWVISACIVGSLVARFRRVELVRRMLAATFRCLPRLSYVVHELDMGRRLNMLRQKLPQLDHLAPQKGRILQVGASLGPGGAERQLAVTLSGLVRRGHRDVALLHHWPMTPPNDFYLAYLHDAAIPYAPIQACSTFRMVNDPAFRGIGDALEALGIFSTELAPYIDEFIERRPEVVHVWLDQMNVTAGLAAVLAGVPRVILSCRSLAPSNFGFNQPYMRPIYRFLSGCPQVTFLNNSQAGADDYRRWLGLPDLSISIIPNGFDFSRLPDPKLREQWREDYRRRLAIPKEAPVLGVVLRMSEEKRPHLWLDVAEHLLREVPLAHFLMVGDGPLRPQLEARVQQVLGGRVHFPGHENNVIKSLVAMDAFLLTSRAEGLPNVLIEAQAVGIPAITVNVGGAAEAIDHARSGWVLDTTNPATIAKLLAKLLSDSEWRNRAAVIGPAFVQDRFGVDTMIARTMNIYGHMAGTT